MLDPLDLLVFFAVLGVMIIVHEFGHFFAAKRAKVAVERFSLGFGPQLISFMRNGTRYAICLIPFGGFIKMAGDSLEECKGRPGEYLAQPVWKRFAIVFSGPLLNYCLGVVLFCFIFFAGYPALTSTIGEVMPGYGAEKVGLRAQDRVVAVEGRPVELWDDLQHEIFTRSSQQAIELSVVRGGSQVNVSVPLVTETAEDVLGQRRNVGRVGIKPDFNRTVFVRHTALESVSLGVKKSVDLTVLTYKAMGLIVTGRLSFKESMTGPVGMYYVTAQARKQGLLALASLVAVLSISLCIFNLLPLPALDGGHIFLMGVEKIRGKGLSPKADAVFARAGFAFLIVVGVLVLYNDLVKIGAVDRVLKLFVK